VVETWIGGATSVAELMGSSPWTPSVDGEYVSDGSGCGGLASGRFGLDCDSAILAKQGGPAERNDVIF